MIQHHNLYYQETIMTSKTETQKPLIVCMNFKVDVSTLIKSNASLVGMEPNEYCKKIILDTLFPVKLSDSIRTHFGQRIVTALFGSKIDTIEQLVTSDLSNLWRIAGIGKATHKEIEDFLLVNGFINEKIVKK